MNIAEITYHVLHVSAKTNWSFVRVRTGEGITGWGECSLNGWEPLQREYANIWWPSLIGTELGDVAAAGALCTIHQHSPGGLIAHSVKSATEQALQDALAQARGVPLWQLFGPALRSDVEVYANINRATQPRTPNGFAASARLAVEQGYRAVKLAPFDGVMPSNAESAEGAQLIAAAHERIRAVREAVGDDVRVMVDCHWRLTPRTARETLDALREVRLHWLECPISERGSRHDEILALRRLANAQGVRLAGAEKETGVEGFLPYLERGLYDTIMPDVKYCGGVAALLRIAQVAQRHGVQTAPHNPTGPICNYASVHACMVGPGCDFLELQVGESSLFTEAVDGRYPEFVDGHFKQPQQVGMGAALIPQVLDAHPFAAVGYGLDPALG
jgi:galactonate dehydratase